MALLSLLRWCGNNRDEGVVGSAVQLRGNKISLSLGAMTKTTVTDELSYRVNSAPKHGRSLVLPPRWTIELSASFALKLRLHSFRGTRVCSPYDTQT